MTPQAVLDRDTIVEDQTATDEPEMCESDWCNEHCRKPPHEAQYVALLPCECNFSYNICQDRVDMFASQLEVLCGCGRGVSTSGIVIWPINGGGL